MPIRVMFVQLALNDI